MAASKQATTNSCRVRDPAQIRMPHPESGPPSGLERTEVRGIPYRHTVRRLPVLQSSAPMSTFLRDVAYAVRNLRRSPGLTFAMVLAFAGGLAVNASAFLLVYALVLKPLPFRDLGTLMTVWESPVNTSERGA